MESSVCPVFLALQRIVAGDVRKVDHEVIARGPELSGILVSVHLGPCLPLEIELLRPRACVLDLKDAAHACLEVHHCQAAELQVAAGVVVVLRDDDLAVERAEERDIIRYVHAEFVVLHPAPAVLHREACPYPGFHGLAALRVSIARKRRCKPRLLLPELKRIAEPVVAAGSCDLR